MVQSNPHVYDLVVIGAGPAGLFCAMTAAKHCMQRKRNIRILILEKNDQAAKKLLIAGSGRCNITHVGPISDFLSHYGNPTQSRFVKPALYHFTNDDLATLMQTLGLPLVEINAGKLFPVTESSRDVRRVLLDEVLRYGVEIQCHAPVAQIEKHDGNVFSIWINDTTSKNRKQESLPDYQAKSLAITTGGCTFPGTGSTGDGYRLAQSFGHTITDIAPALTPLKTEPCFAKIAGISFDDLPIQVIRNGKRAAQGRGDIVLTQYGLSGPGILDLSRHVRSRDKLLISFVQRFPNPEAFESQLMRDMAANSKKNVKNLLTVYELPERFVVHLFERFGIPSDLTASNCDRVTRKKLVTLLCESQFIVTKLGDVNEGMVTRGGIDLSEVNRNTMQSRLVPVLFFAGELLDIDGDTGGYNLQFAFSSGALAGVNIGEYIAVPSII